MVWDAPGKFNLHIEEDDKATGKPVPQECVEKTRNNDMLIAPSTNVGNRGELQVESCLVEIKNGGENKRHRPRTSYYEADNRSLTQHNLRQTSVINFKNMRLTTSFGLG